MEPPNKVKRSLQLMAADTGVDPDPTLVLKARNDINDYFKRKGLTSVHPWRRFKKPEERKKH